MKNPTYPARIIYDPRAALSILMHRDNRTVREVAFAAKVSTSTAYNYLRGGNIVVDKLNRLLSVYGYELHAAIRPV